MKTLTGALLLTLAVGSTGCQIDHLELSRSDRQTWVVSTGTSSAWLRFQASGTGQVELTDDDRDVRALSPGGSFEIASRGWLRLLGRRYMVRVDDDGTIMRTYRAGLVARPIDKRARAWIGDTIQHLVGSGFAAESRVARILSRRGPEGVLDEIPRLSSDYARATYLLLTLKAVALTSPMTSRALAAAGREIRSDYELANVLVAFANATPMVDDIAPVFVQATETIHSDFEHARVLSAVIAAQPARVAATIVQASVVGIRSDYERVRVLTALHN